MCLREGVRAGEFLRRRALTTLSASQTIDVKSEIREPLNNFGMAQARGKCRVFGADERRVGRESEFTDELYPYFRGGLKNWHNDFVYEMKRFC